MARGECFAAFRSARRIDFGRPPGLPDCPGLNRLRVGGHPSIIESSPVLRPIFKPRTLLRRPLPWVPSRFTHWQERSVCRVSARSFNRREARRLSGPALSKDAVVEHNRDPLSLLEATMLDVSGALHGTLWGPRKGTYPPGGMSPVCAQMNSSHPKDSYSSLGSAPPSGSAGAPACARSSLGGVSSGESSIVKLESECAVTTLVLGSVPPRISSRSRTAAVYANRASGPRISRVMQPTMTPRAWRASCRSLRVALAG